MATPRFDRPFCVCFISISLRLKFGCRYWRLAIELCKISKSPNRLSITWLFIEMAHGIPVRQQFEDLFGWSECGIAHLYEYMKLLLCCTRLKMKICTTITYSVCSNDFCSKTIKSIEHIGEIFHRIKIVPKNMN